MGLLSRMFTQKLLQRRMSFSHGLLIAAFASTYLLRFSRSVAPNNAFEPVLEPFDGLRLVDAMRRSDLAHGTPPLGNTFSWAGPTHPVSALVFCLSLLFL